MKLLTDCASPDCLHSVTGIIHDCTFNVNDVTFDREQEFVRVPFRPPEGALASWFSLSRRKRDPAFLLEIGNAKAMRCEDDQGIQTYNLNRLEYRDDRGLLMIHTGIPTKFEIDVGGLHIRVYDVKAESG